MIEVMLSGKVRQVGEHNENEFWAVVVSQGYDFTTKARFNIVSVCVFHNSMRKTVEDKMTRGYTVVARGDMIGNVDPFRVHVPDGERPGAIVHNCKVLYA